VKRFPLGSWAALAALAAVIVALDRWTKNWAATSLTFGEPVRVVGDYVRLTLTRNSGVAFGIGQGTGFPYAIFSIVAILFIAWMFASGRAGDAPRRVALALILGGAIGNLIDRLGSGLVVDFIEIGVPRWYWPVFNVADSAVTVGVVLFALAWTRQTEPVAAASPAGTSEADEAHRNADPGLGRGGAAGPLPRDGAEGPLA
jgi:signal peptidase II